LFFVFDNTTTLSVISSSKRYKDRQDFFGKTRKRLKLSGTSRDNPDREEDHEKPGLSRH